MSGECDDIPVIIPTGQSVKETFDKAWSPRTGNHGIPSTQTFTVKQSLERLQGASMLKETIESLKR